MKRTSSIAALDDTIDTKGLVSEMMLVTLVDGKNRNRAGSLTRNHRRDNNSMGSLSSSGGGSVSSKMSRCSSRGSISGWGSTASRKSYKVDLCSLADEIIPVELSSFSTNHTTKEEDRLIQEQDNNKCCTIAMRQKGDASGTSTATIGANTVLDSWGFFLE